MMPSDAVFRAAVEILLLHEGGLADDKDDPGGLTHFGISLRYAKQLGAALADVDHDGDVDADDIRAMSRDQAIRIYEADWWRRYGWNQLPTWLSPKLLDLGPNMGPGQAHMALQRALVWLLPGSRLEIDGKLGPVTIQAARSLAATDLMPRFRAECCARYRGVAGATPALVKFLPGWLARVHA